MELNVISPSGPWLAPLPPRLLCNAPDLTHHVWVSVQQVCLVTFSPKLVSPIIRWDLQASPSSLADGKWVVIVKAGVPSRPVLYLLHHLLPSHHVPVPTNFLLSAGWENLYAAGHAPITLFTCLCSL